MPSACLSFVGLGALGLPMAFNLCKASYKLRVHTRSRKAEADLAVVGATPCESPSEAVKGSKALMICVSDDNAVEEVLFGPKGAAQNLKQGSVVIDFSTISPETAEQIASRLSDRGVDYLDAPVTGGTEGAAAGKLTVLVGGNLKQLERVKPVLEVIGESIHHFGAVGKGQQVKAINQVLVAGSYAALAEAIGLGQRLKLPMESVIEALKKGAAGSWALNFRSGAMLAGEYPIGFKLALHHKDLGIALDTALLNGVELPITRQVALIEQELIQQGHGEEDVSALHRWIQAKSDASS